MYATVSFHYREVSTKKVAFKIGDNLFFACSTVRGRISRGSAAPTQTGSVVGWSVC